MSRCVSSSVCEYRVSERDRCAWRTRPPSGVCSWSSSRILRALADARWFCDFDKKRQVRKGVRDSECKCGGGSNETERRQINSIGQKARKKSDVCCPVTRNPYESHQNKFDSRTLQMHKRLMTKTLEGKWHAELRCKVPEVRRAPLPQGLLVAVHRFWCGA